MTLSPAILVAFKQALLWVCVQKPGTETTQYCNWAEVADSTVFFNLVNKEPFNCSAVKVVGFPR
jgi:hypothetical protein